MSKQGVVVKRLEVVIPKKLTLSVAETARLLGIGESALRKQIYRKRFPHRRVGRRVLVVAADLELFILSLPGESVQGALEQIKRDR